MQESMCFDVVYVYENIRTCLFAYNFLRSHAYAYTHAPELHMRMHFYPITS